MKKSILVLLLLTILSSCNNKQMEKPDDKIVSEKNVNEQNKNVALTIQIIDKLSDEDIEGAIYENIVETFKGDFDNEFEHIKKLSAGQQMFWATWILEAEVNNGGFNQYYYNSDGEFAEMALNGLKIIKANKFADLVSRANIVYQENKERLSAYDDGSMESFSKSYKDNPLNKFDDEFYDLEKKQNISKLRIKYIREHESEFVN
ncbi:DMP19 family protein [Flavobacterium sp. 1355]|uniref:DMP19 family protein n=1 Tax=Flavobacterium sp. 1355 TaxID=2806571 RepID=UPI001AE4D790|nr:DMP19 family protein [Flavobacterium sp. 1355]MBP1225519.1 hypothetical protein [Flavobacterium sp. 1355]